MTSKYRTATAAVLASLFLFSCPVMAAGGGGDTTDDDDSKAMTYITIGVIVVVGGFFLLDVINSSDEEVVPADSAAIEIVDTRINWDDAFTSGTPFITVAVSVFPGDNGFATAMELINVLNEMTDDNIAVYNDPLDLGAGSAGQRATIAREYFGVDYLIFQVENPEILLYGIASPDSILWTSTDQSENSMVLTAEEFLRSGIF
jgi:hypothetical protein